MDTKDSIREQIADEVAKQIEHILSKFQLIDRINNDEVVKREDYLSIGDSVVALFRVEIEKLKNPYNSDIQGYHYVGWQVCKKALLEKLEGK